MTVLEFLRSAAVTPTAGGLVFFGNVGTDIYAVNAETGEKLWAQKLGGAGRRRHHLCGERRAKSRGCDRPRQSPMARSGQDREDRNPRARRRNRKPMRTGVLARRAQRTLRLGRRSGAGAMAHRMLTFKLRVKIGP